MTTKTKTYDASGYELDDKGNRVLKHGQFVKVPMVMMDGKMVPKPEARPPFRYADARPKEAPVTDAERTQRQKNVAAYNDKVSNAWKRGADFTEELPHEHHHHH